MSHIFFLAKNRNARRRRLANREAFDHPKVKVKKAKHYDKRDPVADVLFDEEATYIPFRFIRGQITLPGSEPTRDYVAQ